MLGIIALYLPLPCMPSPTLYAFPCMAYHWGSRTRGGGGYRDSYPFFLIYYIS